jgi:hypothetical protein
MWPRGGSSCILLWVGNIAGFLMRKNFMHAASNNPNSTSLTDDGRKIFDAQSQIDIMSGVLKTKHDSLEEKRVMTAEEEEEMNILFDKLESNGIIKFQ